MPSSNTPRQGRGNGATCDGFAQLSAEAQARPKKVGEQVTRQDSVQCGAAQITNNVVCHYHPALLVLVESPEKPSQETEAAVKLVASASPFLWCSHHHFKPFLTFSWHAQRSHFSSEVANRLKAHSCFCGLASKVRGAVRHPPLKPFPFRHSGEGAPP